MGSPNAFGERVFFGAGKAVGGGDHAQLCWYEPVGGEVALEEAYGTLPLTHSLAHCLPLAVAKPLHTACPGIVVT